MPDRPSPAAAERHRLFLNFPGWLAAARQVTQGKVPHRQPPASPGEPDPARPLLWLACREGLLLLVNESGGHLQAVRAEPYGYHLQERMRLQIATDSECFAYHNVPPGSAVLVAEYDGKDREVVCGVRLAVQAPRLGCLAIHPPTAKGGVAETVLLWAHGESPGPVTVLETLCLTYPYDQEGWPARVPTDLARALARQRAR